MGGTVAERQAVRQASAGRCSLGSIYTNLAPNPRQTQHSDFVHPFRYNVRRPIKTCTRETPGSPEGGSANTEAAAVL